MKTKPRTKEMQEFVEKGSKNRLKNITNKKFRTCFISPLSEFELAFGEIWGHGLSEEELTSEQKVNRQKWEQIRQNILNKGNTQRRALLQEIELYDINFNGYHMEIRPKGDNKNGQEE